jgi:hypothetical protein
MKIFKNFKNLKSPDNGFVSELEMLKNSVMVVIFIDLKFNF